MGLKHAFTIVEVLVIIIILTLLITMFAPLIYDVKREVRMSLTRAAVAQIEGGCRTYYNDHGEYPGSGRTRLVLDLTGCEVTGMIPTMCTNPPGDIKDGWGFRTVPRGKVYGPYNDTHEMYKERVIPGDMSSPLYFIDPFGNPILYFRCKDTDSDGEPDAYDPNDDPTANVPAYLTTEYFDYRKDFAILTPAYAVDVDGDSDEDLWDVSLADMPRSDVTNAKDY